MTKYLVGFSVIHLHGVTVSRAFKELHAQELVTPNVIMRWESEIVNDYDRLTKATVRVFTFQALDMAARQQ